MTWRVALTSRLIAPGAGGAKPSTPTDAAAVIDGAVRRSLCQMSSAAPTTFSSTALVFSSTR